MPAFLLLGRIGRFPVLIPWFPIWMILLPFSCLAWLLSAAIGVFVEPRFLAGMKAAPGLALALTVLHGTEIDVRSNDGMRVSFTWL